MFPRAFDYKNQANSKNCHLIAIPRQNDYLCMIQIQQAMKKILIISGIIAAFLCLSQNADAQYRPNQIHRDGASFVDGRGQTLSDSELIDAIGENIFQETVIGARKQYTVGRKLLISGIAGTGVGVAGILGGAALIAAAGPHQNTNNEVHFDDPDKAEAGAVVLALGTIATALGGTALSAGIPLKVIGQSRLNWVENDFNERSHDVTARFGATPSGVGLAVRF